MKQEKKKKIMTVVGIVILLLIVIGATYAYFIAQIGSGASTNVTIEADTVDSLQFTTSGELGIKLNQDNFASGEGNKKASTTARATLIAGTNRNPSYTYNVYLAIKENTFFHTTNDNKPELILRVTNPSNEAITTLEGLIYNETLSGFDITEESGVITLASNYEITTTSTLRQNWKVEVEVINLDSDQSENAGRRLDAELIIRQDVFAETLADVCASGDNFANCLKDYSDKSDYAFTKIIHHDGTIDNDASDGSYRYAGGNYTIAPRYQSKYKTYGKFSFDTNLIQVDYNELDSNDYYFLAYDLNKIEYSTFVEAKNQAEEDGALIENVKNYVCFGSDEVTCPNDNLYRIIGVFGSQVKLVKADLISKSILGEDGDFDRAYNSLPSDYTGILENYNMGYYYFNYQLEKNYSSNWETSLLNKTNLNTNYLNNIGEKWSNLIEDTNWNIGSYTSYNAKPKVIYDAEIEAKTSIKSKIGLINISDYGFAGHSNLWGKIIWGYRNLDARDYDWMYLGINELTLTLYKESGGNVFTIHTTSGASSGVNGFVRPAFYLKSNVTYKSGDGSKNNPYRVL